MNTMLRTIITATLVAMALPAAAESVPATNYSDLWDNSTPVPGACPGNESGWGITFAQHADSRVEAVWYTYDPRSADPNTPGNFRPLWLVMPVGSWTSPTQYSGDMFVTLGTPFFQAWNAAAFGAVKVGTFVFNFNSSSAGTFQYTVAPAASDVANSASPAFNMPPRSSPTPTAPATRWARAIPSRPRA
jgi:hypothetical protein